MKYAVIFFFIGLSFIACQKEISGGGEVQNGVRCTACSYLPVCDSAKLTYIDSTPARTDTIKSTLAILGDTTINGRKFTKVTPFAAFNQGLLYNCDGGDYRIYQPVPNLGINVDSLLQALVSQAGFPFPIGTVPVPSKIETVILKATAAAGTTWSDTVFKFSPLPIFTVVAKLDYKLEEKNVPHTVYGKVYPNVIHVSSKLNISVPLVTIPVSLAIDYYFAEGVGLIESRTLNNGVLQALSRLK